MDNYERQLLESAMELLHRLAGYADAKADFKPILRFADNDEKVITFPKKENQHPAPQHGADFLETIPPDGPPPSCKPAQAKNDNTPHDEIEFTDQEISLMPKKFKN